MDFTYTTALSGGTQFYQVSDTITADGSSSASPVIPDSSTDLVVLFSIANASASDSAKALGLLADQDLTVKIALADDTVLQTINLTANVPYVWAEGLTAPTWRNGGDVAQLLVSNSSGSAATLSADALFDSTP